MSLGKNVRTVQIGEKEFQIYVLPAGEGIVMAQKLSKIVMPLFALPTGADEDDDHEINISFVEIATKVTESLDDTEVLKMILRLTKEFAVDGKPQNFDTYFSCNYGELVQLMSFAISENFGSFFEGLGTIDL